LLHRFAPRDDAVAIGSLLTKPQCPRGILPLDLGALYVDHALPYLTACLVAALLLLAAGAIAYGRARAKIRRLADALDYMSQGLCTFDATGRIVVCNRQFLRMYKLSPEVVKPGCSLRELIEHRKQTGLFTGDPAQYCKEIIDGIAAGKISRFIVGASDGRVVHAINAPTPDGGWVSTHEDVTEQQLLQQQRDDMAISKSAAAWWTSRSRHSAAAWKPCSRPSATARRR
jgi:PAS domain-containing protein